MNEKKIDATEISNEMKQALKPILEKYSAKFNYVALLGMGVCYGIHFSMKREAQNAAFEGMLDCIYKQDAEMDEKNE